MHDLLERGIALVGQTKLQAGVQERHHLESLNHGLGPEIGALFENSRVGPKSHRGPGPGDSVVLQWRLANHVKLLIGYPSIMERHEMSFSHAVDLDLNHARQGVHHRDADAVKAAGNLVALASELAACVQDREHNLGGRKVVVLLVPIDRDAAAVVPDLDTAVGHDPNIDAVAVAGHGLIDRIVDDLPDEVVKPGRSRRTDVHTGSLANGLQAFENLDVAGVVAALICGFMPFGCK